MADTPNDRMESGNGSEPDRLLVLPLQGAVAFPHMLAPMGINDPSLVDTLRAVQQESKRVALVALQPDRDLDAADETDPPFFAVGTRAAILHMVRVPDGSVRLLVQGRDRIRARRYFREGQVWYVDCEPMPDIEADGMQVEALHRVVLGQFQELARMIPDMPAEIRDLLAQLHQPGRFADVVLAHLDIDIAQKQALLEEPSVLRRLDELRRILGEEQQVLEYGSHLQRKVKGELEKAQREFWLREQLKVIQQELGESETDELAELRRQADEAGLPEVAREQAKRELVRLERIPVQSPEYHMVRTYLEWLIELPWKRQSPDHIDLDRARRILDGDHYDLDEVKDRILELLAVRKLNPDSQGPILCFVGPPGVGKTSLGRSIATALGREFTRISLGGVRDEAEIRGHRRTYVGSLPGRIIQGMRRAGTRNPVFMLDEIDKIGLDFRGDPTAALLEVLDPAQNHSFSDHYLEVPFDLSRTLFIGTANTLGPVPPALRDRLEVLRLPGYTEREKCHIARQFLVPRQIEAVGLKDRSVRVSDGALQRLIAEYTREAGVRELERRIAAVLRKVAVRSVEGDADRPVRITRRNLARFAGKRRYERELAGRSDEIGTATALAYTPEGGQILFVEAVRMPGKPAINLTGQLGGVMKESARAALSFLRSHAAELGLAEDVFRQTAVHVHIPAGATPKDGPSAGVALVAALASSFTGRPVRHDLAMTGEITLRGRVLPVGGIKEKLIAAADAGISAVLLPRRNEVDLEDVPPDVLQRLDVTLVEDVSEALQRVLGVPPERPAVGQGDGPWLAAS